MRSRALAAAAILSGLFSGCQASVDPPPAPDEDEDASVAEDGSDTSSVETDVEVLTASLVSPAGSKQLALDDSLALYTPRGCLTVAKDAAAQRATYAFRSCAGPSGLGEVSGDLVVDYRQSERELHLAASWTNFAINAATFDGSFTTDITAEGVSRTMRWKAQLSGTTRRGRTFTRSMEHVLGWKVGERCFSLTGRSEGEVGARALRVEIVRFDRCRGGCPSGEITLTNLKTGKAFTMRYDGTDHATLERPNGKTKAVKLLCRA